MKDFFEKINFDLNIPSDIESLKGEHLFRYGSIAYYKVKDSTLCDEINSKFYLNNPTQIFFVEVWNFLNPHIDNGVSSCLNYYINSGDLITKFWTVSNSNYKKLHTTKIDSNNSFTDVNPYKFLHSDLKLETEFVAENLSAYILNIGKIHSVEKINENSTKRLMLQLQWNCSYEELQNIIQNNLSNHYTIQSHNMTLDLK